MDFMKLTPLTESHILILLSVNAELLASHPFRDIANEKVGEFVEIFFTISSINRKKDLNACFWL